MENFFMKELWDAYITAKNTPQPRIIADNITEYNRNYTKACKDGDLNELFAKYPLYANNIITYYNKGNVNNTFKRRISVTRPVSEQRTQWDNLTVVDIFEIYRSF